MALVMVICQVSLDDRVGRDLMDPVCQLPQPYPRRMYERISPREERIDHRSFPVCHLLRCHERCWTHIKVVRRSCHLSRA
jgi:hypothetical protein